MVEIAIYLSEDFLTGDLLVELLSFLPVKSILRFRCVCKLWNDLIKSPFFISTHLTRSSITYTSKSSSLEGITPEYLSELKYLNRFPYKDLPCYAVHGFCDGLICLTVDSATHILWNPAIRKSITLPDNYFKENIHFSYEPLGFGYDYLRKDYKVIKINYHPIRNVEIFSLRTKSWKVSNSPFPNYSINHNGNTQIFHHGSVHWLAFNSKNLYEKGAILSFDVSNEEFGVIMLPEISTRLYYWKMYLFMESFAIVVQNKKEDNTFLDIWVMKVYGVVDSWMKAFTIDKNLFGYQLFPVQRSFPSGYQFPVQRSFPRCDVVGFARNGDLMVDFPGVDITIWIDLPNKTVSVTEHVCGIEGYYYIHRSYGESLLLLDEVV